MRQPSFPSSPSSSTPRFRLFVVFLSILSVLYLFRWGAEEKVVDQLETATAQGESRTDEIVQKDAVTEVHGEYSRLVEKAKTVVDDGLVIVVYASHSYRQPLLNWLIAMQKVRKEATRGVLLVCLDEQLASLIRDLGWDCYIEVIKKSVDDIQGALDKHTVKSLWVTRVQHLTALLRAGISVVLSDTDAIWLKDATKNLRQPELGDVIASKANFPYDSPWGATLCMGFIFFRSTPEVVALAELALQETILAQDDQIGFNRALFALPFEDPSGKRQAFGRRLSPNGPNTAKATFFINKKSPLRVTILSHSIVARYCALVTAEDWQGQLEVAHCHVNEGTPARTSKHKGNQDTHTAILVKYDVYNLPENWDELLSQQAEQVHKQGQQHIADFELFLKTLAKK